MTTAETATSLEDFSKGELLKMVTEGWVGRVTRAFQDVIAQSFEEDQVLRPVHTRDEIQHRFNICVRGFITMRRDMGWAVPRILDELPTYLRCQLDGIDWAPDEERQGWTAPGQESLMEIDGPDEGNPVIDPSNGVEIGEDSGEG